MEHLARKSFMSFPSLRHNPSTAYLVDFALFILGMNGPVQALQGVGTLPVPATEDLLQTIKKKILNQ